MANRLKCIFPAHCVGEKLLVAALLHSVKAAQIPLRQRGGVGAALHLRFDSLFARGRNEKALGNGRAPYSAPPLTGKVFVVSWRSLHPQQLAAALFCVGVRRSV